MAERRYWTPDLSKDPKFQGELQPGEDQWMHRFDESRYKWQTYNELTQAYAARFGVPWRGTEQQLQNEIDSGVLDPSSFDGFKPATRAYETSPMSRLEQPRVGRELLALDQSVKPSGGEGDVRFKAVPGMGETGNLGDVLNYIKRNSLPIQVPNVDVGPRLYGRQVGEALSGDEANQVPVGLEGDAAQQQLEAIGMDKKTRYETQSAKPYQPKYQPGLITAQPGVANDPAAVREWQQFLIKQGLLKPGEDSGVYDAKTVAQTMVFQADRGLKKLDGIVGPETRREQAKVEPVKGMPARPVLKSEPAQPVKPAPPSEASPKPRTGAAPSEAGPRVTQVPLPRERPADDPRNAPAKFPSRGGSAVPQPEVPLPRERPAQPALTHPGEKYGPSVPAMTRIGPLLAPIIAPVERKVKTTKEPGYDEPPLVSPEVNPPGAGVPRRSAGPVPQMPTDDRPFPTGLPPPPVEPPSGMSWPNIGEMPAPQYAEPGLLPPVEHDPQFMTPAEREGLDSSGGPVTLPGGSLKLARPLSAEGQQFPGGTGQRLTPQPRSSADVPLVDTGGVGAIGRALSGLNDWALGASKTAQRALPSSLVPSLPSRTSSASDFSQSGAGTVFGAGRSASAPVGAALSQRSAAAAAAAPYNAPQRTYTSNASINTEHGLNQMQANLIRSALGF